MRRGRRAVVLGTLLLVLMLGSGCGTIASMTYVYRQGDRSYAGTRYHVANLASMDGPIQGEIGGRGYWYIPLFIIDFLPSLALDTALFIFTGPERLFWSEPSRTPEPEPADEGESPGCSRGGGRDEPSTCHFLTGMLEMSSFRNTREETPWRSGSYRTPRERRSRAR